MRRPIQSASWQVSGIRSAGHRRPAFARVRRQPHRRLLQLPLHRACPTRRQQLVLVGVRWCSHSFQKDHYLIARCRRSGDDTKTERCCLVELVLHRRGSLSRQQEVALARLDVDLSPSGCAGSQYDEGNEEAQPVTIVHVAASHRQTSPFQPGPSSDGGAALPPIMLLCGKYIVMCGIAA